jgi:hypothetical protein
MPISTKPELNADEKLKAAAPKLLEALQNFMGLYNTPVERMKRQGDEFYREVIETARKAIEEAI